MILADAQKNFHFHGCEKNIGTAFLYNFGTGLLLSGGSVYSAIFVGGTCAVATGISVAVKPVFMALNGLENGAKPGFWQRFGGNIAILTLHSLVMSCPTWGVVHLVGMSLMAAAVAVHEADSTVQDFQVFHKLETFLLMGGARWAHTTWNHWME